MRVAVVIPCFRVKAHIVELVKSIPPTVSVIVAVDDACPEGSGAHLRSLCDDPRLQILTHEVNQGVGGAVVTGCRAALAAGSDVVVKLDGDGQMDPAHLPRLLKPITAGKADFTKGNRFYDLDALKQMPLVRRLGNLALTVLTKFASGHWHVSDPTNGYVAIHRTVLSRLDLSRLDKRYFFETSLLIQLNILRAVLHDVPIPARYADEKSNLSVLNTLLTFPGKLLRGFATRFVWRYFIYEVSAVTLFTMAGLPLLAAGTLFGGVEWVRAAQQGAFASAGTVALALLPTILGCQLLLQAMLLDVMEKPTVPLSAADLPEPS
ncbi:MAG: glycosyltransferase family 2 protein [Roseimicrobium sp.]